MQFDSLTFIVFFFIVVAAYRLVSGWSNKKNLLLAASYIFYAAWNPLFLPLLISTSIYDWYMARKMAAETRKSKRKLWLWSILCVNLGVLGYFKYAYFLTDIFANVLQWMGFGYDTGHFSIILPIGISFYMFHSLSYCIDVYRKKILPVENIRDYLLYVGFFPQLVAGPIVRWHEMREQIEFPRTMTIATTGMGISLMVVGLFAKIVLADTIFAPVADNYFNNESEINGIIAWIGALAFSGQIFCDFAGYTTCALGAALVLGFRLPINFLNPYAACGFSDFWQRWHISLSSWLRDYVYIGLGGNRFGKLFTYRNLMITMLLGGLWHGAAWTFVIWGGLHGMLLILERLFRSAFIPYDYRPNYALTLLGKLLTFPAIVLTWVWFRSAELSMAWNTSLAMLSINHFKAVALTGAQLLAISAIVLLVSGQLLLNKHSLTDILARIPSAVLGALLALMASAIILSPGESYAFIYFQF